MTERMESVDAPTGATSVPEVDAVLAGLERLDELEVDRHVAVFEQAHTRLRAVLDGAGHEGVGHGAAGPRGA